MNLQQQQIAVDRALTSMRHGVSGTNPVDFVEFMLTGVGFRAQDAIAEDIVDVVLRVDDLQQHVKDRLDVHQAFLEAGRPGDARRAAENIVKAIRAIVAGRL